MVLSAAPNENSSWVSPGAQLWAHGGADAWYVCLRRRQPLERRDTPTSPTAPTPASSRWSVAGQVVATGSQQGVGGATLTPGWSLEAVTADAAGNYELGDRAIPPTAPYPVTISQLGFMSHDVWITWQLGARTNVTLDLVRDAPPFSMEFYRQFARDTVHMSDGSPWPLQRWTASPSFYLRTVDDAGGAIEPAVIATTVDALRRAVPGYTAGQYSVATVETGTDVRPAARDWINVDFKKPEANGDRVCGTAFVGRNPGTITLYLDICGCGSIRIPPAVAMHEVGHAMGFFHVADKTSLMYPFNESGCRPGALSAAETYHAAIVYARPRLNADPDHDPASFKTLAGSKEGPLVVN